jgi:hypothetical protein
MSLDTYVVDRITSTFVSSINFKRTNLSSRIECRVFGKLNEQVINLYAMKAAAFMRKHSNGDESKANSNCEGNTTTRQ